MRGTSKKQERYRAAMERHNEVGHPEGYEGPCWGPTEADFAFVDDMPALMVSEGVDMNSPAQQRVTSQVDPPDRRRKGTRQ